MMALKPFDFFAGFTKTTGTWRSWASLSLDGVYRYLLARCWLKVSEQEERDIESNNQWAPTCSTMGFVMLNPSTADASEDDPTIRRCIGFAKKHGCQRILVANLFAYRATDPRELARAKDPVGPLNHRALACISKGIMPFRIAAWGRLPNARLRQRAAGSMLACASMRCLGKTKHGDPRHPLMLPYSARIEPLRSAF